jgi:hypothetical protein
MDRAAPHSELEHLIGQNYGFYLRVPPRPPVGIPAEIRSQSSRSDFGGEARAPTSARSANP